jgi:integrase
MATKRKRIEPGIYRTYLSDGTLSKEYTALFNFKGQRVNQKMEGVMRISDARAWITAKKAEIIDDIEEKAKKARSFDRVSLTEATEDVYEDEGRGIEDTQHGRDFLSRMHVMIDVLGDPYVDEIDNSHIKKIKEWLKTDNIGSRLKPRYRANSTIRAYLVSLKTVLDDAHKNGLMLRVPKIKLEDPKKYARTTLIEPEEWALIRASIWRERHFIGRNRRVIIDKDTGLPKVNVKSTTKRRGICRCLELMALTGMRSGEASKLRFGRNIDMKNRLIRLTAEIVKGQKRLRTLRMLPTAHAILVERLQDGFNDRPFPYTTSDISRAYREAREDVGLRNKEFVPHGLRHMVTTTLLKSGVPLKGVQTIVGHENASTTQIYEHLLPMDFDEGLNVLEDFIGYETGLAEDDHGMTTG